MRVPIGDEGFCVSKEDGIYADPEDETAFYVCEGEKATKKFCPTGLKFNPVISGCDIPEDVKYVGNEADSPGMLNANENTRWTSLAGNDGLKELYVGGSQVPRKNDGKIALNTMPPHKLFSINIFNGAHSLAANKLHDGTENSATSNERFQENVQNNVQNVTTMGPSLPKENFRKLESAAAEVTTPNVHGGLASVPNEKLSENPSMFMAQKIESADNKNLNHAAEQQEGNHRGESPLISQNSSSTEVNTKHPIRHESFVSSDHRKIQAYQDVRNTNTLQGHLPTSPHKVFAINIYGSHPQLPNIENQIHPSGGNRPIGNHKFQEANQHRNTNFLNNGQKVPSKPLNFQSNQGDVLNAPVSDYQQESRPHPDLRDEQVQEDLFTTNDSTSTPLHFKLKINMDNSGKQPVINCTLSQCSENDFAIKDYQGKGSQSHPNGSIIESAGVQQNFVDHKDNHGSQVTKEDGDFHITFTTDSSKLESQPHGMKGFSPNQLIQLPMPSSHTQTIQTNPPQRENTSQITIQSSHGSPSKEAQEVVVSHQRNDTTTQATSESAEENRIKTQDNVETIKGEHVNEHGERTNERKMVNNFQAQLPYQNQEENRTKTQDSAETIKGDNVIQHSERENEVKVINHKESAANGSTINNSSTGQKFPLSRKYEAFLKKPVVSLNAYNGRRLQYANKVSSNETNISIEKEQEKVEEQRENTKLQTSSQGNGLAIQLENNSIKNQFHEQGQLSSQDFVQIQSRPQLKIILKNPGKISNPLKRRSDAKGRHIVQILKSLIDRPLKLGSKNKEVASMLSSLANKPIRGRIRGNMPQDDYEAIKDSGSIAQSILEANKEYLDAVAMQGMVFSDGDPETENMTNIVNSYQGHGDQEAEIPQWTNPDAEEKGASTGSDEKSPNNSALKEDWLNDEHLITRIKDNGGNSK